jgi:hypothetical protein
MFGYKSNYHNNNNQPSPFRLGSSQFFGTVPENVFQSSPNQFQRATPPFSALSNQQQNRFYSRMPPSSFATSSPQRQFLRSNSRNIAQYNQSTTTIEPMSISPIFQSSPLRSRTRARANRSRSSQSPVTRLPLFAAPPPSSFMYSSNISNNNNNNTIGRAFVPSRINTSRRRSLPGSAYASSQFLPSIRRQNQPLSRRSF